MADPFAGLPSMARSADPFADLPTVRRGVPATPGVKLPSDNGIDMEGGFDELKNPSANLGEMQRRQTELQTARQLRKLPQSTIKAQPRETQGYPSVNVAPDWQREAASRAETAPRLGDQSIPEMAHDAVAAKGMFAPNKPMGAALDFTMLGGALRGGYMAGELAKEGHPTGSGAVAAASMLPIVGGKARGLVKKGVTDLVKQAEGRTVAKALTATEKAANKAKFLEGSAVKDVVYHGTDKKFTKFNSNKSTMGGIHWFTSDKGAIEAGEVGAQGKGAIMDLIASIKKPAGWAEYEKYGLGELKSMGFDGAVLPDPDGTLTGFVFDGKQLKSATKNVGTYDPTNKNILYDLGGAAGQALRTRIGGAAALGATGAALQTSDDEKIKATGVGMMGLAVLSAVGKGRIRSASGAVGGKIVDGLKTHPMGVRILDTISKDILADPKVKTIVTAYDEGIAMGKAKAARLSSQAKALGPSGDRAVSDVIERESFEPLTTDQSAVIAVAERINDEFTALGRGKVSAGLLSAETVAKREGKYLPRMYAEHLGDQAGKARPTSLTGPLPRIKGDKRRLDELGNEVRNELGEIRESSFRTAVGITKGYGDLAAAKMFESFRDMPGIIHPDFAAGVDALKAAKVSGDAAAVSQAKRSLSGLSAQFADGTEGFRKLPDTPGMGVLRGAVVRADVADYLGGVEMLGGKAGNLLTMWKRVHTVFNPGTHVGNVASNGVVAHMFGLPLWEQPAALRRALKDFNSYGPTTKLLAEKGILSHGLPTAGEAIPSAQRSMKTALTELSATTRPETAGVLATKGITPRGPIGRIATTAARKMEAAYSKEDGVFRVAVFQKAIAGGMAPDAAAEMVDRVFVNYTTRSPLLGAIKTFASPFIMYPVKALPAITEQIIEHPWRWATLAAMWGGLDQYSQKKVGEISQGDLRPGQRTNKSLGYLLPGFTQLPMTNKRGDKYGVDLARFTPFSALTGSPVPGGITAAALGENVPGVLQPSGPLVDVGARLMNTDPFTGDKLIKPGDGLREKAGVVAKGAASLALPSALSFHTPRIAGDIANRDPAAAGIDALGLVGARPQVVRPGMQQFSEQRNFTLARGQILADLRRDLRKNKSPERDLALRQRAAERIRELATEYQQMAKELNPTKAVAKTADPFASLPSR